MLRNNKGISLITAVMTVLVILIILSTITYTASNNVKVKKINEFYNDLREITDEIQIYYAKHGKLPVQNISFIVEDDSIQRNYDGIYNNLSNSEIKGWDFILKSGESDFSFDNLYNPNDYDKNKEAAVYYVVDLSKIDNVTLKNSEGTYLVNEMSKTVYYYDGIKIDNKLYHRLPLNYIEVPNPNAEIVVNQIGVVDGLEIGDLIQYNGEVWIVFYNDEINGLQIIPKQSKELATIEGIDGYQYHREILNKSCEKYVDTSLGAIDVRNAGAYSFENKYLENRKLLYIYDENGNKYEINKNECPDNSQEYLQFMNFLTILGERNINLEYNDGFWITGELGTCTYDPSTNTITDAQFIMNVYDFSSGMLEKDIVTYDYETKIITENSETHSIMPCILLDNRIIIDNTDGKNGLTPETAYTYTFEYN